MEGKCGSRFQDSRIVFIPKPKTKPKIKEKTAHDLVKIDSCNDWRELSVEDDRYISPGHTCPLRLEDQAQDLRRLKGKMHVT